MTTQALHPDSWLALAHRAGDDKRKKAIAWHLAMLLRVPGGSSEEYASIVQGHVEAARELVKLGAPSEDRDAAIAWGRAELDRDTSDDLVEFEVRL